MIFTILLTLWNSEQKNGLLIKKICFSSDFDETWWSCSYPCVLKFHQVSSILDEEQKSFINSPFFCSEVQSVSWIVKIVHSVLFLQSFLYANACSWIVPDLAQTWRTLNLCELLVLVLVASWSSAAVVNLLCNINFDLWINTK